MVRGRRVVGPALLAMLLTVVCAARSEAGPIVHPDLSITTLTDDVAFTYDPGTGDFSAACGLCGFSWTDSLGAFAGSDMGSFNFNYAGATGTGTFAVITTSLVTLMSGNVTSLLANATNTAFVGTAGLIVNPLGFGSPVSVNFSSHSAGVSAFSTEVTGTADVDIFAVPEPATALFVGLGALTAFSGRRRRRTKAV